MEKSKIQWDGNIDPDSEGAADNNEVPSSVDIIWGGYAPVWLKSGCYTGVFPFGFIQDNCQSGVMDDPVYFEDYDINGDGVLDDDDSDLWIDFTGHPLNSANRLDISNEVKQMGLGNQPIAPKAPKNTYTWGDVAFALEVFDGIGTGTLIALFTAVAAAALAPPAVILGFTALGAGIAAFMGFMVAADFVASFGSGENLKVLLTNIGGAIG